MLYQLSYTPHAVTPSGRRRNGGDLARQAQPFNLILDQTANETEIPVIHAPQAAQPSRGSIRLRDEKAGISNRKPTAGRPLFPLFCLI
ncbi:hypothetical protein, partial [Iodidimonas nitroreducens]|uniref:hypothetical protein n=1 Tax=Iodidimonas nitroreducens TaxID=1236968 RepID=UPI0028D5D256